jgi:hypothetical protein
VPDLGVLCGRRAGGVLMLAGSVTTRGAASYTLCDRPRDWLAPGSLWRSA